MIKLCYNCGSEFEAKNKRARFCSSSCRSSSWQQQARNKKKPLHAPKGRVLDNETLQLLNCCSSPQLRKTDTYEITCYNCGHQWFSGLLFEAYPNLINKPQ